MGNAKYPIQCNSNIKITICTFFHTFDSPLKVIELVEVTNYVVASSCIIVISTNKTLLDSDVETFSPNRNLKKGNNNMSQWLKAISFYSRNVKLIHLCIA